MHKGITLTKNFVKKWNRRQPENKNGKKSLKPEEEENRAKKIYRYIPIYTSHTTQNLQRQHVYIIWHFATAPPPTLLRLEAIQDFTL